jgi:hypothetical protein
MLRTKIVAITKVFGKNVFAPDLSPVVVVECSTSGKMISAAIVG